MPSVGFFRNYADFLIAGGIDVRVDADVFASLRGYWLYPSIGCELFPYPENMLIGNVNDGDCLLS